jgi:hypothetical protein
VADGSHSLVLTEKDTVGHTLAASISVTVNNKGISYIAITRPGNGAAVRGIVTVTGLIHDSTPGTWKLTDNGAQIGSGTGSNPNIAWSTSKLPDGSHKLVLTETDAAGHTASASITVVVNNTGVTSIKFTEPANRAVVNGTVTVKGVIADATPGAWTLDCSGAAVASGTGINIAATWNTARWNNGSHTLVLTEIDAAGNKASAILNVKVNNP